MADNFSILDREFKRFKIQVNSLGGRSDIIDSAASIIGSVSERSVSSSKSTLAAKALERLADRHLGKAVTTRDKSGRKVARALRDLADAVSSLKD